MTRFLLLAALLLLTAGCGSLTPEYQRPAAPVSKDWPAGPAYAETAPNLPDADWRKFFLDERLQKILALALANNRDLRVATLNIERARAQYRIQRSKLFPHVDAGASAIRQRVPEDLSMSGQSMMSDQYGLNVGVTAWELDFFDRLGSLKDASLEQYLATEEARRAAQIALLTEVADTWLLLLADRERLRLARLTFDAQKSSWELVRSRHLIGVASELDVREAQTRMESARVDMARYLGLATEDENVLNFLVGAPVAAPLLPEGLDAVALVNDIGPGLPSDTLLRRPDILQSEHLLKAMNANIGAARAAFFPRITLTGTFGLASTSLNDLFQPESRAWTFMPQITVPIFDAGYNRANLAVAEADRAIALARYERAIQQAFREVANALVQRKSTKDQFDAQQSLVEASSEAYRLASARYQKEVDSYLNVLDAQRSLYTAQQGLITLRLTRLSSLVRLYATLGGGA